MAVAQGKKIRCVLIAGGKYHDIDFARLELLKLLARRRVRGDVRGLRYCLRREKARPVRPRPRSASVVGSGTTSCARS